MKIKSEPKFVNISDANGVLVPNGVRPGAVKKVPAGAYNLGITNDGIFYFKPLNFTSDQILDLPSKAYQQVINEMERFLKPETATAFKELGYVYKRSALLHGLPGTGKTCIVNRIAVKMIESGNVVLFSPDPRLLEHAFSVLEDLQPEQTTMVIFEEMDQLVKMHEDELLVLLDGQIQKDNIIYLATTNFLDRIPKRMYRPGRMSSVIEVEFPDIAAREAYLRYKLANEADIQMLAKATDGLSIDEVKEVIQSVILLGNNLQATLERIRGTRTGDTGAKIGFKSEDNDDEDDTIRGASWLISPTPADSVGYALKKLNKSSL